jgi:hypothetical protein
MDQGTAQTLRDIELTRERLDGHLQELEEKLPGGATIRRIAGLALGGGAGTTVFWFVVRRVRKRRRATKLKQPAQMVVNVLPESLGKSMTKAMEDGTWKPYAAAAGGAWVLFRLAELRQLRRMRTAMLAR